MNPIYSRTSKCAQRGSVMLEALIAVMIFAIGILGTIGLQVKIMSLSTDARYRTDATFLANQIIAQIWVDSISSPAGQLVNSSYACGQTNNTPCSLNAGNGNAYTQDWVTQAHGADGVLPPYGNLTTCPSTIAMSGNQVTVTLQWKMPQEAACHAYKSMTEIQYN